MKAVSDVRVVRRTDRESGAAPHTPRAAQAPVALHGERQHSYTSWMGGAVVMIASLLVLVFWTIILVVMLRASRVQRARARAKEFGGRYSYLGFVLRLLGDKDLKSKVAERRA